MGELSSLLVGQQTLKWEMTRTSFGKCQFCTAAYARALSTHTSSHMAQLPTPPKQNPLPYNQTREETHAEGHTLPHFTAAAAAAQPHHKHDAAPAATRAAAAHKLVTKQRRFLDSAELAQVNRRLTPHLSVAPAP